MSVYASFATRFLCFALFLFSLVSDTNARGNSTVTGVAMRNTSSDQKAYCVGDEPIFDPIISNPGDQIDNVRWRGWADPDNNPTYFEHDNGTTETFSGGNLAFVGTYAVQVVIVFAAGDGVPAHTSTSPIRRFEAVPPNRAVMITRLPVNGPYQQPGSSPNIQIDFKITLNGRDTLVVGEMLEKLTRSPYGTGEDTDWGKAEFLTSSTTAGEFTDMKGVNATDAAWASYGQTQIIDKLTCQYAVMLTDLSGNYNRYELEGTYGFIFYKNGNDVVVTGF